MVRSSLFVFVLLLCAVVRAGTVPPELEAALAAFRAEGSPGWSFTQTTTSGGQVMVERFDAAKPSFRSWSLLEKNGRSPTEAEKKEYQDRLSRQPRTHTAPNMKDQIRHETCESLGSENGRTRYRFQLKPGGEDDKSAEHMIAIFSLHETSGTIERVELVNERPFSPMFAVKIDEARTVITYTLPTETQPTLLREIHVRMRGRAMFFKSLDQEMTVSYGDYVAAPKKP